MQLPIPEAFVPLAFEKKRYKVYHGGRGAAKSRSFGLVLLAEGMRRKIGVLCARELQVSIKDSVHQLLSDIIAEHKAFTDFYEIKAQEIVGLNGSRFSFKGLKHNVNEIKSYEGVDYCWVEEAQAVSDRSWETLIPTVRKEGSEIWVSFNPKNPTDPTWQRFVVQRDDDMLIREVNWRDNPFFPSVLEKERLKLKRTDPEAYDHVWEGKFDTRYSGAVYAKFIKPDQIIQECVYDPSLPVFTSWDLGYDDATLLIWYQLAHREIRIIDYYEANFQDPLHYCEQIYGAKIEVDERDARTGKILRWHFGDRLSEVRAGYVYAGARHYAPHDAANKLFAAGGRSFIEQAAELGIEIVSIPSCSQQDSEAALRSTLQHCWFNQDATKDLVQALYAYHYEYDEDLKIYKKLPVHDWSSHAADAAELMARMWLDRGTTMEDVKREQVHEKFHKARRVAGMDGGDPYRLKKRLTDKRFAGRKKH